MKTIEIISQDVFDKIRSRFGNLQMGNEAGAVTMDPRQARFYDFDFVVAEQNLGRVSISINELGTLKIFYGKTILEDADTPAQKFWYSFLREMRLFAMRRLLRFDTRDITKSNLDKDDFQYLATNGTKEQDMNMNESVKFKGSKKTSYGQMQKAKVIVKHHNAIEDESFGARKRPKNIRAIYVENEEGERFKYPFIHTAGALAMAQHVSHGGKPYDDLGEAIIGMSEQISQCTSCLKHMSRHDGMHQEAHVIAERVGSKLQTLRDCMKSLGGVNGYRSWAEGYQPGEDITELDQATMEDYKSKFTVNSFQEDLAQYFPLIHSIMQEAGTVDLEDYVNEGPADEPEDQDPDADDKRWDDIDEGRCDECGMWESKCSCDSKVKENYFTKFENWADRVTEGYLEPDTIMSLKDLLDNGLSLGVDGTGAIEALEGIGVHDENLQSALSELAKVNPEADPAPTILAWLAKDDPEAAAELGHPEPEPTAPAPTPEPTADAPAEAPAGQEQPVAESPEDRTSYKVARYMFDKGMRYSPEKEKHIISKMDDAMKKLGMDHKQIRFHLSYDEDFIPDTLSELQHMEQAVDEISMLESEGSREDQILRKDSGRQVEPNIKEIAEMVKSFYNRNHKEQGLGPFPKGKEGVIIHIKKELGERAGMIAEKFVDMLSDDSSPMSNTQNPHLPMGPEQEADDHTGLGNTMEMEDIMRLAGLAK
jgi:hypothetical protein